MRFLATEVIQVSTMDCGPATIKCVLEGFGINASYERLRELCHTSIDGTSINTVEATINRLGLSAEQHILPIDYVVQPEAALLPAIVVVRLPNNATHFIVIWRRLGPWLQIMDPAKGRYWTHGSRVIQSLYQHRHPITPSDWSLWSQSNLFIKPLTKRLLMIGFSDNEAREIIGEAHASNDFRAISSLDAAARMINAIVKSGGVKPGAQACSLLLQTYIKASEAQLGQPRGIPRAYWSVVHDRQEQLSTDNLNIIGAVLVSIRAESNQIQKDLEPHSNDEGITETESKRYSSVLTDTRSSTLLQIKKVIYSEIQSIYPLLLLGGLIATIVVIVEAVAFKGMLDLVVAIDVTTQQMKAAVLFISFLIATLLLNLALTQLVIKVGRHVESKLHIQFLTKLARLPDLFFQSRLISDLAERSHGLHQLRNLPTTLWQLYQNSIELIITIIAISWLHSTSGLYALALGLLSFTIPIVLQNYVGEYDMSERNHNAAVNRSYLDALLGSSPIRAHGAAPAVQMAHDSLVNIWAQSLLRLQNISISITTIQRTMSYSLIIAMIITFVTDAPQGLLVFLLLYWALKLPSLSEQVSRTILSLPALLNLIQRLLEPLNIENDNVYQNNTSDSEQKSYASALSISLRKVDLCLGGQKVLDNISLEIKPNENVAIVGSSGAGKSTLAGLLLGLYTPKSGAIYIDNEMVQPDDWIALRKQTIWVDPTVTLWNDSLLNNISYGNSPETLASLETVLDDLTLISLIAQSPNGLNTKLGEGGSKISGGEGQRIRLARGLLREEVRLVILDEPFRGLDRTQRHDLLLKVQSHFCKATLILITHDVFDTQSFERTLVMKAGRIIEDRHKSNHDNKDESPYWQLVSADKKTYQAIWQDKYWKKWQLKSGKLFKRTSKLTG